MTEKINSNSTNICICGGGNLAHALIAQLGGGPNCIVSLLTRSPGRWSSVVEMVDSNGESGFGRLHEASSDPERVISNASIVVLALPAFARKAVVESIVPHLAEGAILACFPAIGGFDWMMDGMPLPKGVILVGSQRVPCIARTIEYGKKVQCDFKPDFNIATDPRSASSRISTEMSSLLRMGVNSIGSFLEINLVNSNPILHPSRLYSLGIQSLPQGIWSSPPLFYEGWDAQSTQILLEMDQEIHDIIAAIPCRLASIVPILDHYGVISPDALTRKIKGIPAFKGILAPVRRVGDGWGLDASSRYFAEDIPYGLCVIKRLGERFGVSTPMIDRVLNWAQGIMGKNYLTTSGLNGMDEGEIPRVPDNLLK